MSTHACCGAASRTRSDQSCSPGAQREGQSLMGFRCDDRPSDKGGSRGLLRPQRGIQMRGHASKPSLKGQGWAASRCTSQTPATRLSISFLSVHTNFARITPHLAMACAPDRILALPQPRLCLPAIMRLHRRRPFVCSKRIVTPVVSAKAAAELSFMGGDEGQQSYSLSLRTADPSTATGLVHRCLVTEAQTARRVSLPAPGPCLRMSTFSHLQVHHIWAVRLHADGGCVADLCKPPKPFSTHTQGTSSTLTRSEVRGGGKKPYAQKGTGNARSGSRRSPLRPGGGISFGPKVRSGICAHMHACYFVSCYLHEYFW